jgi:3'(2'), 5'-bisphosphate nucleotidase
MSMSVDWILPQLLGAQALTAARAVAEGADLAEWVLRQGSVEVRSKTDASPVTIADFAVQALIAARLGPAFPDVPLVAEEDAAELRRRDCGAVLGRVVDVVRRFAPRMDAERVLDSIDRGRGVPGQRYWTLDPVDGTRGFLRGGQYAVALALIQDGTVMVGILACPHLSLRGASIRREGGDLHDSGMAIAVRGRGAWWVVPGAREIMRLNVSGLANPPQARILHSFETAHSDVAQLGNMLCALGSKVPPLLLDSQAKHVVLAARHADLLLRFPTDPGFHDAVWDHAAGALLVSEAGGQVSDLAGRPLDFSTGRRLVNNSGLVASNGWLHDAALRAIEASRADTALAGNC